MSNGEIFVQDTNLQYMHRVKTFQSTVYVFTFQLDDAALQLYKDGDYGSYLDLEASISEQQEEFEGFQSK